LILNSQTEFFKVEERTLIQLTSLETNYRNPNIIIIVMYIKINLYHTTFLNKE